MCKLRWILSFCLLVCGFSSALAIDTAPGASTSTHNFLGPTVNASITKPLGYNISSSLSIEGGPRQYRGNATLGWVFAEKQRIKLTGEYLWQKIDYGFYSGVVRQWVNQGALGVNYQYMLFDGVINDLRVGGYYSHAPSIELSTQSGSFTNVGSTSVYVDQRRIAGSNAAGISPGFALHPWYGAQAVLSANYDNVRYDTQYLTAHTYSGFGGTIDFKQALPGNLQLNLLASSRKAFNNYQAGLNWSKTLESGLLLLGVTGGYNKGKHTLPNTSVISFNINYAFDQTVPIDDNDIDYKLPTSLSSWVTEPAVRMPQVLAIADEAVSVAPCTPPTFSGTIPDTPATPVGTPFSLATASYFSGSNLTFSATGLPSSLSMNSSTGTISGNFDESTGVTVTATNACGSAASNTFVLVPG